MMVMILPWVRHRREAEQLRAKLDVEKQATKKALERTNVARMQAAQSDRSSKLLLRQIEKNGWTQVLENTWGRA